MRQMSHSIPPRATRRAFTLAELLIVMAIVVIIATITVIAVGAIAKEAKVSSGKNTVIAALDQARAYAMKNNTLVVVTFRVSYDTSVPGERQYTQVWASQYADSTAFGGVIIDRYAPIPDLPVRDLPVGVKVAGPWYDFSASGSGNTDFVWISQPDFRAMNIEGEANAMKSFGVIFGPNGDLRTQTSETGAANLWIDYDRDGNQDVNGSFWDYDEIFDENNVNPVPFITVYDDDKVRELRTGSWSNATTYRAELSTLINRNVDRIHFNRYSGAVLR